MDYFDLGAYSRRVTTSSQEAQLWMDRAFVWIYAYNHEEAIACCERALAADPDCAMAHWGIAYAIGPNYNKPWEAFEDDEKPDAIAVARRSIEAASSLAAQVTPIERALIKAIAQRYPQADTGTDDFASSWL